MPMNLQHLVAILILVLASLGLNAPILADNIGTTDQYKIQPGDVLMVSVWKEEDLTQEVIVRPDGQITFPLVGEADGCG